MGAESKIRHVTLRDLEEVKDFIKSRGSVSMIFAVYGDFFNYKSGVYVRTSEVFSGWHAVKVLGWGTDENGVDYWLCANSWGTDWGDEGFFKIKRGSDEANCERFGFSALFWECDNSEVVGEESGRCETVESL